MNNAVDLEAKQKALALLNTLLTEAQTQPARIRTLPWYKYDKVGIMPGELALAKTQADVDLVNCIRDKRERELKSGEYYITGNHDKGF
jgi:hypothetical protein